MRGSAPLSHVDHQVMVMSELDSLREYKCMMAKRDKSLYCMWYIILEEFL